MLRAFARALRNEVPAEYVFGLSGAMGRPVRVPEQVYAEQRAASLAAAAAALGIRGGIAVDPEPAAPTPSAAGSR